MIEISEVGSNEMKKRHRKFEIIIKLKNITNMEQFIEKRIIPLKDKYPYADIRIEVLQG